MNNQKIKGFKEALLQERQELIDDLINTSEDFRTINQVKSGDIVDQASNFYEKQFLIGLSSSDQQRLEDINKALLKIEKFTFGICESCNKKIDEKRLEAIPYASLCMNCKTKSL